MKYTFWKDDKFYVGFLNDYPDYETQGVDIPELEENLRGLYVDISGGEIPFIRQRM